jgi:hypothetical protein
LIGQRRDNPGTRETTSAITLDLTDPDSLIDGQGNDSTGQ